MKKFFLHLTFFVVFAGVFYLAALMAWGTVMPDNWKKNLNYRRGASGFTYTRLSEVKSYGKTDILFAGSSHAYRGFDPRIFKQYGYSSFNLGSSSQTPLQTQQLLKKYIDRLSPSVVVYEIYPYTFSSDGVESSLDIIANDDLDEGSLTTAFTINNIKTYNTLLYACIKRTLSGEKPVNEKPTATHKTKEVISHLRYINGGFMEYRMEHADSVSNKAGFTVITSSVQKNMQTESGIVQTKDGKWLPKTYQVKAFEETLEWLRSKNIRVVLVQAPVHSVYYSMIMCNKEIDGYFASKGSYYNFNRLMHFNDSLDFADYNHLNQEGVQKMNTALIEKVFPKK